MIKKVIPLAFLLVPLTFLTSCNNKESKYPTKKDNPFTITCTKGPMTLYLTCHGEALPTDRLNLMWSKDMKEWEEKDIVPLAGKDFTTCWSIDLIEGESVYLAGNNPLGLSYIAYIEKIEEYDIVAYRFTDINPAPPPTPGFDNKSTYNYNINENDEPVSKFTVSGNIMSLIKAKKFSNLELPETANFSSLFKESNVENAEDLILPSKKLTYGCCVSMFENCCSLTKSPALPSTELANHCYFGMFNGCESLTSTINLPANILKERCYEDMFKSCTKLSHVRVGFGMNDIWPEEPKSEDYIPTDNWLQGVAENGIFEWAGDAEADITHDESHVPSGWEVRHIDL